MAFGLFIFLQELFMSIPSYQILPGNNLLFPGTPVINTKNDLLPCTPDELKQACSLISPSNNSSANIMSLNNVIASLRNKKDEAVAGQTTISDGMYRTVVPLGSPDASGLEYATVSESFINANGVSTLDGSSDGVWNSDAAAPAAKTNPLGLKQNTYGYRSQQEFPMIDTIGGSDLSIFYLAEVIDQSDLLKGIPATLAKKNLIVVEFDSVLSLTYSTIRERFPVRSLGSVNAKAITNGIRTISGHIAFNIFTEDVLSRLRAGVSEQAEKFKAMQTPNQNPNLKDADKILGLNQGYSSVYSQSPLASQCKSMLLDQLPPFHLLIMGVTERGNLSRMLIKNVSIIDENQYQGTQQPNIINKVTWVAEDIVPMTKTQYDTTFITGTLSSMEEGYVGGNWDFSGVPDMTASSVLLDIQADNITRSTLGAI
jgi:hypothetical protein